MLSEIKKASCHIHDYYPFYQTAESVAESVLNLASAEAIVRVTVDSAEEINQSNTTEAPVVVHSSQQGLSAQVCILYMDCHTFIFEKMLYELL